MLVRTGVQSQMTDEPIEPDRQDNLWEPVPGDQGAHGSFDAEASDSSLQLWINTRQGWQTITEFVNAGLGAVVNIFTSDKEKRTKGTPSSQYEGDAGR